MMACQQEYYLAKQFLATKATCQLSFQPKAIFQVKSQKCYSSLLLFTIHYSSTGLLFMVTVQDSFFAYLRRLGPHL